MARDEPTEETSTGPQSKVARLIREYELDGTGDELVAYWTGRGTERRSLRELADHLNQELLRATMERAGMNPLDGEAENFYRLLTGEDVSAGSRTEAETTLRREGVDVDKLERDFVARRLPLGKQSLEATAHYTIVVDEEQTNIIVQICVVERGEQRRRGSFRGMVQTATPLGAQITC